MNKCLDVRTVISRKKHRCEMCGGVIPIGVKYVRNPTIFEGEFCDNKYHVDCHRVNKEFGAFDPSYFREKHENDIDFKLIQMTESERLRARIAELEQQLESVRELYNSKVLNLEEFGSTMAENGFLTAKIKKLNGRIAELKKQIESMKRQPRGNDEGGEL